MFPSLAGSSCFAPFSRSPLLIRWVIRRGAVLTLKKDQMVALHTLLSNLVFSPLPLSLSPPFPGFFRCFSHPLVGFWHQTNWGVALHAEKRQRDGCGPPRTQQNMGNLSTGHWEKYVSVGKIFQTIRYCIFPFMTVAEIYFILLKYLYLQISTNIL